MVADLAEDMDEGVVSLARSSCTGDSKHGETMAIQLPSGDLVVVDLPRETYERNELNAVTEQVCGQGGCNVIVDLSGVDIVGSRTIAGLLNLRQKLHDRGHRLVLCGAPARIRGVFSVTRLDGVFEFADDKLAALTRLEVL